VDAAAHAAAVMHLAQAVLEFESTRETEYSLLWEGSLEDSEGLEERQRQPLDSLSGMGRYLETSCRVRTIQGEILVAEESLRVDSRTLADLRDAKARANERIVEAQEGAAKWSAVFNSLALPLVKIAREKLGDVLQSATDSLRRAALQHAGCLAVAHRRLSRLHAVFVGALPGEHTDRIAKVAGLFETSQRLCRGLCDAIEDLRHAGNAKIRELQLGGRGEAAAREQAMGVVADLRKPMTAILKLVRFFCGDVGL